MQRVRARSLERSVNSFAPPSEEPGGVLAVVRGTGPIDVCQAKQRRRSILLNRI
jgi:hypothetical protein